LSILKKLLLISVSVVLILLFGLVGCGKALTTQNIIDNSISASGKTTAYKLDMNSGVKVEGTLGGQPGSMNLQNSSANVVDSPNKQIQMNVNATADVTGQDKQTATINYYLMTDWMYVKLSIPQQDDKWVKMKIDANVLAAQDQLVQQMTLLKSASQVQEIGSEDINGIACYILNVTPDPAAISTWLRTLQQTTNIQELDLTGMDAGKLIKSSSLKLWINEKDFSLVQGNISILVSFDQSDLGANAQSGDKLDMNVTGTMKFHDFNVKAAITLPAEAQNAEDVSGQ
jgi:hypothetical protein